MFTKKEFSKSGQLSKYDIKSYLTQAMIVIVPYVLANMNDIEVFLTNHTGDAETVAIIVSIVTLLLKKLITNYDI